jgi:hypothetical protein
VHHFRISDSAAPDMTMMWAFNRQFEGPTPFIVLKQLVSLPHEFFETQTWGRPGQPHQTTGGWTESC